MIGIYSILAYSLNLVTGLGGLLVFCHAAFYGVGAYAFALLQVGSGGDLLFSTHVPFPVAIAGAAAAAAAAAAAIGLVAMRFRGDFLVFATLGFQMIVYTMLYNWTALTRGAFGIPGIPRPELFGWRVDSPIDFVILVALANALLLPLLYALYRSPFGMSLKALREDERAAESLGISALGQHLAALVVAGACAGVAGALYAGYVTYIDPSSFNLRESLFVITLLLLGGSGNVTGPIVGTVVMILVPELLRFLGLPDTVAANVREILYGLALICLMYWRPQGIAGSYSVR